MLLWNEGNWRRGSREIGAELGLDSSASDAFFTFCRLIRRLLMAVRRAHTEERTLPRRSRRGLEPLSWFLTVSSS
jgi:hypothetical protein